MSITLLFLAMPLFSDGQRVTKDRRRHRDILRQIKTEDDEREKGGEIFVKYF